MKLMPAYMIDCHRQQFDWFKTTDLYVKIENIVSGGGNVQKLFARQRKNLRYVNKKKILFVCSLNSIVRIHKFDGSKIQFG